MILEYGNGFIFTKMLHYNCFLLMLNWEDFTFLLLILILLEIILLVIEWIIFHLKKDISVK